MSKYAFVALFPYFFVDSPKGLEVGEVTVRSSHTDVLKAEKDEIRSLLEAVAPFFRFGENQLIRHWSYCIDDASSESDFWEKIARLRKIADTLRFTATSDLTTTTAYSTFDFWVFQLGASVGDHEYMYFDSMRNGISSFGFRLVKGEHKNTFQAPESVSPQLIAIDDIERNRYFRVLYRDTTFVLEEEQQKQRVFRAIEWFNRSFLYSNDGVDPSEAILNIHTALEALLRLDDDDRNAKAQIKTALLTLVGHRSEISQWFESFHRLRNSLVHGDAEPSSFQYIHPKSKLKRGTRHHLLLARQVFLACLNAMFDITEKFPLLGFEETLIPNEIRLDKALRALKAARGKNWKELVHQRDFGETGGLRKDDISSPKELAPDFLSSLLPHIRMELEESNGGGENDGALLQLKNVEEWSGRDLGELAVLLSNFLKEYRLPYFELPKSVEQTIFRGCVYSFLEYASWRLLVFYG